MGDINPSTMRGPGDFEPPEGPDPVEGRAEDVMAMVAGNWGEAPSVDLHEEDGVWLREIGLDWTDARASERLLEHMADHRMDECALIVRRSVPIAVVGMREGWAEPVVVRLPDPGEARPSAVRVMLTPADLRAIGHVDGEQGIASSIRAVVSERDALRARLDEREADMHARIRVGYDATVADCWRAAIAKVEAERDALRAEVARLRAAAIRAITAAWSSGYAACDADADDGETIPPDYELGEVEASEYLDEQMEVSDG